MLSLRYRESSAIWRLNQGCPLTRTRMFRQWEPTSRNTMSSTNSPVMQWFYLPKAPKPRILNSSREDLYQHLILMCVEILVAIKIRIIRMISSIRWQEGQRGHNKRFKGRNLRVWTQLFCQGNRWFFRSRKIITSLNFPDNRSKSTRVWLVAKRLVLPKARQKWFKIKFQRLACSL